MNLNKLFLFALLLLSFTVKAEAIFWEWDKDKKYPFDDGYKFSTVTIGGEMRNDPLFLKERDAFREAYAELCDQGLLSRNIAGAVGGLFVDLFVINSDQQKYGVTTYECYFPKPNWKENKAKFDSKTTN